MLHSELSPVQLYYLKYLKKANMQHILGFIIRPLILNRVLQLQKMLLFPDVLSKRTQMYFKIRRGENFATHEPQFHEELILNAVYHYNEIQPKKISNLIIQHFKMPTRFIKHDIITPLASEKYLKSTKVTKKGKQALEELNGYMQGIEQMFEELLNNNIDDESFTIALLEVSVYLFFIELNNNELYNSILERTKEIIYCNQSLEIQQKLQPLKEAINLDISFFCK